MFLYNLAFVAGIAVIVWLLARKVSLKWFNWVLGLIGWGLLLLALQNYGASVLEAEPKAAAILLAIFGVPGLILLLLAYFLPLKKKAAEA